MKYIFSARNSLKIRDIVLYFGILQITAIVALSPLSALATDPPKSVPVSCETGEPIYVERYRGFRYYMDKPLPSALPRTFDNCENLSFEIEELIRFENMPWPYSIEVLDPDRVLVSHRCQTVDTHNNGFKGFTLIRRTNSQGWSSYNLNYEKSKLPENCTRKFAFGNSSHPGLPKGKGWLLDIKKAPDYNDQNPTIFIAYGDQCDRNTDMRCGCESYAGECKDSNDESNVHSMLAIAKGRIDAKTNEVTDIQTIYKFESELYSNTSDMVMGGRLATQTNVNWRGKNGTFLYFSIGVKGTDDETNLAAQLKAQDIAFPEGKIHRIFIPDDTAQEASAAGHESFANKNDGLNSIWAIGVRSPQGLDFDSKNNLLFETEMGPKNSDEINVIVGGKNYGWPCDFAGSTYANSDTIVAKDFNKKIEASVLCDNILVNRAVIDFNPDPAISSLVVDTKNALNVSKLEINESRIWFGSLKAGALFTLKATRGVGHVSYSGLEKLVEIARIRDLELYEQSLIVLVENASDSMVLLVTPKIK